MIGRWGAGSHNTRPSSHELHRYISKITYVGFTVIACLYSTRNKSFRLCLYQLHINNKLLLQLQFTQETADLVTFTEETLKNMNLNRWHTYTTLTNPMWTGLIECPEKSSCSQNSFIWNSFLFSKIENKNLSVVQMNKDLKVISNWAKLDFNEHINNKISECNKITPVMKKISLTLSRKTLLTIYKSFIRATLAYLDIIYDKLII